METKKIKAGREDRIFNIAVTVISLVVLVIVLYPLYFVIIASISSPEDISLGKVTFLPSGINFAAYKFVLEEWKIWRGYLNTIFYTFFGTLLGTSVTLMAAFALSRRDLFGRNVITKLFVFTMFFSGGLIPTYMVVKYTGLLNTIWSLILPGAVSVFNILILMNFFRDLPKEIEESALIDGAGHFTIMARLFLPLAKPALATIVLFIFVNHWNSWFDGLIYMSLQKDFPLQTYLQSILTVPDIQNMTTEQLSQLGKVSRAATNAAQIVISSVPILIIYPFLQRYYTKGLTLGSVKG